MRNKESTLFGLKYYSPDNHNELKWDFRLLINQVFSGCGSMCKFTHSKSASYKWVWLCAHLQFHYVILINCDFTFAYKQHHTFLI